MGFDLVAISGGKGMRGPQSSGLLIGRKDLIAAARLNAPPNGNTVGRGMKVNKEEMFGLLAAIERYVALDHEKEQREFQKRAEEIAKSAGTVPRSPTTCRTSASPGMRRPSASAPTTSSRR
jgi:L-seryl-tRNA(Ser) seleniumtransferase